MMIITLLSIDPQPWLYSVTQNGCLLTVLWQPSSITLQSPGFPTEMCWNMIAMCLMRKRLHLPLPKHQLQSHSGVKYPKHQLPAHSAQYPNYQLPVRIVKYPKCQHEAGRNPRRVPCVSSRLRVSGIKSKLSAGKYLLLLTPRHPHWKPRVVMTPKFLS